MTSSSRIQENICFPKCSRRVFCCLVLGIWISVILICSGDIHRNPGPSSVISSSSISSPSSNASDVAFGSLNMSHNFIYRVQSILSKLESLHAELLDFDVLTFTETWLSPAIDTDELFLESYQKPERKGRTRDARGAVMSYVNDGFYFKRRKDIEFRNIESKWIEIANGHRRILLGLFYPTSFKKNFFNLHTLFSFPLLVYCPAYSFHWTFFISDKSFTCELQRQPNKEWCWWPVPQSRSKIPLSYIWYMQVFLT